MKRRKKNRSKLTASKMIKRSLMIRRIIILSKISLPNSKEAAVAVVVVQTNLITNNGPLVLYLERWRVTMFLVHDLIAKKLLSRNLCRITLPKMTLRLLLFVRIREMLLLNTGLKSRLSLVRQSILFYPRQKTSFTRLTWHNVRCRESQVNLCQLNMDLQMMDKIRQ